MYDVNLQTRLLHKAPTPLEYNIYKAGLEWDLLDPIVIEKGDGELTKYADQSKLNDKP